MEYNSELCRIARLDFFARSRGFSVAVVLAIKSQPATVVQTKTPGQVCRTLLSLSHNQIV